MRLLGGGIMAFGVGMLIGDGLVYLWEHGFKAQVGMILVGGIILLVGTIRHVIIYVK